MSAKLTDPREVFLLASFKDYRASVGVNLSDKMWLECARQALDAWDDFRKSRKKARAKRVKKFVAPTPAEVEVYSISIGWPINGEDWVLHYEKKEWMYGKNSPVVNWKLAVQTWKRSKWKTPNAPATTIGAPTANYLPEPEGWKEAGKKYYASCSDYEEIDWLFSALTCTWESMPRHWKPKIAEICQQQKQPTETKP